MGWNVALFSRPVAAPLSDQKNCGVQPEQTILISLMLSHPGPDKSHVNLMHRCIRNHVSTLSNDVGFYSRYVKNDVTFAN